MNHTFTSARNVFVLLRKVYQGNPSCERNRTLALKNMTQIMKFLLARKFGWKTNANLFLGPDGRTHCWPLIERSDLSVLEEVFIDHEYNIDIKPPEVVFDLGANFGAASIYLAQKWPKARIFSVEPSPAIFQRLLQTTAGYSRITCINCAVGERDGTTDFFVSVDHIGSSLLKQDINGHTIRVETRKLATLMAEYDVSHIDLLKFDVEGAEEGLFRDAALLGNVDTLVGEVHKDLIKIPVAEFLALFDGYTVQKKFENTNHFIMTALSRSA